MTTCSLGSTQKLEDSNKNSEMPIRTVAPELNTGSFLVEKGVVKSLAYLLPF